MTETKPTVVAISGEKLDADLKAQGSSGIGGLRNYLFLVSETYDHATGVRDVLEPIMGRRPTDVSFGGLKPGLNSLNVTIIPPEHIAAVGSQFDVTQVASLDEAKGNFTRTAGTGLGARPLMNLSR